MVQLTKCQKAKRADLRQLIDSVDAILFDGDGVLWRGKNMTTNANRLVDKLDTLDKKTVLVTNNSARSRKGYADKADKLGFVPFAQNGGADSVVTTSAVAADYLKAQDFQDKVYLIGGKGLSDELELANIEYENDWDQLRIESDDGNLDEAGAARHAFQVGRDEEVKAVIMGFDAHFNYLKMCRAAHYLHQDDCQFIGTNADESFPDPNNILVPATGCFVESVALGIGRRPAYVGKPMKPMFDYVRRNCLATTDIPAHRILMIGDRLNTDMQFANNNGMKSLCVLTGCTDEAQIEECDDQMLMPDYYTGSVDDLYQALY